MGFSASVKLAALQRADGRCECAQPSHAHDGRCAQRITLATARFEHVAPHSRHGHDGISNCEVFCSGCGSAVQQREWAAVWS